jgi:hypothetical protein
MEVMMIVTEICSQHPLSMVAVPRSSRVEAQTNRLRHPYRDTKTKSMSVRKQGL